MQFQLTIPAKAGGNS